jgi:large subunit ribosomal protein L25
LIRLEMGDDTHLTLARELQRHPVRRDIMHVDFVAVDRERTVTVDVPLHLEGDAQGADEGGVVDQVLFSVSVEVLPLEVPDVLTLDVSDMQVGDVKRLEDVALPDGVTLLEDPDRTVVSVYIPSAEVPEDTVAEEEAASVEEAAEAAEAADDEGGDE